MTTGCLSAEPGSDSDGEPDHGDVLLPDEDEDEGEDDPIPAIQPDCTTPLELAFVSHMTSPPYAPDEPATVSFEGLALFVNPGDDALDLSGATVALRALTAGVGATIDLERSMIALPAGEAHGRLPPDADELVLNLVPETWSSSEAPGIAVDLEHTYPAGATFRVDFDVRVGPLLFPMRVNVDVVAPEPSEEGRPGEWTLWASDRIPAVCDSVLQPD